MHALVEPLVEVGTLLGYAVGMSALTGIGLLAERTGFADLAAGDTVVGIWLVAVGAVALFAGLYMFGYRRLWPRLLLDARRLLASA